MWGLTVDVDNMPVMQEMMDFNEHTLDYRESWIHAGYIDSRVSLRAAEVTE